MKPFGFVVMVGGAAALAVTGAVLVNAASALGQAPVASVQAESSYDVNDSGQTFGSAMGVPLEAAPDLVRVISDQGREGYVYARDLYTPPPSSPEEAIATQVAPGEIAAVLDVFSSDGKTKIGTFTIVGSPTVAEVAEVED